MGLHPAAYSKMGSLYVFSGFLYQSPLFSYFCCFIKYNNGRAIDGHFGTERAFQYYPADRHRTIRWYCWSKSIPEISHSSDSRLLNYWDNSGTSAEGYITGDGSDS